jgi:hypothetical protein
MMGRWRWYENRGNFEKNVVTCPWLSCTPWGWTEWCGEDGVLRV